MSWQKRTTFNQTSIFIMLTIGVLLIIISAFYASSFLANLGTAAIFWGVVLLYTNPVKHVPLAFLNASTKGNADNVERILSEFDLTERGIYLPPKNLKDIESTLIFIPKTTKTALPTAKETTEKLYSQQKDGLFLTPPGLELSRLFEHEVGASFTKMDFKRLHLILPKSLTEGLEIAENVEIRAQENIIIIELTNSIFDGVCQETNNQPRTHEQVGCLLTSALACALAKVTGKPIIIQNETTNQEHKTVLIEFFVIDN